MTSGGKVSYLTPSECDGVIATWSVIIGVPVNPGTLFQIPRTTIIGAEPGMHINGTNAALRMYMLHVQS